MVRKIPKQRGGVPQEELNAELFDCLRDNNLECVKYALQAGADVNTRGINDNTALIKACFHHSLEIVKELIRAGADVNLENTYGETALMGASSSGELEKVKELIRAGADVNARSINGNTAITKTYNNFEIIKTLIEAGADINNKDNHGQTKIYIAAYDRNYEFVKSLLSIPTLDTTIKYRGKTLLQLANEKKFSNKINNLIFNELTKNARNVSALKQTLGRNTRLPSNVVSSISGYLSGKPGTMNMQLQSLKNTLKGGRKTRKMKRGSKRTTTTRKH